MDIFICLIKIIQINEFKITLVFKIQFKTNRNVHFDFKIVALINSKSY